MAEGKSRRRDVAATARRIGRGAVEGLRERWRSIVGVAGLLAAALAVLLLAGAAGIVDLPYVQARWGTFGNPAVLSLGLTSAAFGLGFLIAIPLGLARAYAPGRFRRGAKDRRGRRAGAGARGATAAGYAAITAFVEGVRGTPFLVQMFIVFYFVTAQWPRFSGVFTLAGLLALLINTAAYQSEVLRAGFQSVGQTQIDAAKAIGMRGSAIFAHVTLPQALRLVTLPLTNEWISLFKVSSVLAYISVPEMYAQASDLGARHPIEGFLMVAVLYLAIIVPLGRVITYVERKRRIPGLGTPVEVARRPRRRSAAG